MILEDRVGALKNLRIAIPFHKGDIKPTTGLQALGITFKQSRMISTVSSPNVQTDAATFKADTCAVDILTSRRAAFTVSANSPGNWTVNAINLIQIPDLVTSAGVMTRSRAVGGLTVKVTSIAHPDPHAPPPLVDPLPEDGADCADKGSVGVVIAPRLLVVESSVGIYIEPLDGE